MTQDAFQSDREDASRWAAVFDAVVQGVVTIRADGTLRSINPAGLAMFGYREAELLGQNVSMLMPAPDSERHDGYLQNYFTTGIAKIIGIGREVNALKKDGTQFPIHLSVGRYESDGNVEFVGLVHDLTAQRRAEEQLAERDQVLRATLDDAPLASAKLREDGTILSTNRSFVQLAGWSSEDLCTKRFLDLFGADDGSNGGTLEDWVRLGARDAVLTTASGENCFVRVHLQRLTLPSRTVLLLAQIEDHTNAAEAKIHRERLERMDRISLAGEMASGIAHEVNQPLSAIANYSRAIMHMLEVEKIGSEELRSTVDKVRVQSHRAGEIVRRMGDFVSRHSSEPEPTSVNTTIKEVLSFAELSVHGRKVKVETELTDQLPYVFFDRVQLQQVVLNLVNNAVEACQRNENCRILIRSLSSNASTITLQVIDNGSGIDTMTESRLFEPFFSSKRDGTGMGLAISRSIVEAQGGTLGFARNPGPGVTFFVDIPILRPGESP